MGTNSALHTHTKVRGKFAIDFNRSKTVLYYPVAGLGLRRPRIQPSKHDFVIFSQPKVPPRPVAKVKLRKEAMRVCIYTERNTMINVHGYHTTTPWYQFLEERKTYG